MFLTKTPASHHLAVHIPEAAEEGFHLLSKDNFFH